MGFQGAYFNYIKFKIFSYHTTENQNFLLGLKISEIYISTFPFYLVHCAMPLLFCSSIKAVYVLDTFAIVCDGENKPYCQYHGEYSFLS